VVKFEKRENIPPLSIEIERERERGWGVEANTSTLQ